MTIHFYNEFHAGDVFFSRAFINLLRDRLGKETDIVYHHNCSIGILKDLPYVTELPIDKHCIRTNTITKVSSNETYVNTWYGQGNFQFFHPGQGTTLKTVQLIMQNASNVLFDASIIAEDENIYPSVNYSSLSPCQLISKKQVLICNDPAMSGQSNNMSFELTIDALASNFPDITFFVTRKNHDFKRQNVIFTDDIFPVRPNLLEISNLSNNCNLILGRSSGPYSYCMSKKNIMDSDKTLASVAYHYLPGIWDTRFHKCRYFHLNVNDENALLLSLLKMINEYVIDNT